MRKDILVLEDRTYYISYTEHYKCYYLTIGQNTYLHREDGPASIRNDNPKGEKVKYFYLMGKPVSSEEVFKRLPKEKQIEIIFNSFDEWK